MSSTSQQVLLAGAAAGGGAGPLDGLANVTGAWSFGRKLLSAYAGTFADAPVNTTLYNQQGTASRDLTTSGISPTARAPALSTAGPNSRACGDFDGSNDCLVGQAGAVISSLGSASAFYVIISGIFDTLTLNDALKDRDHRIWIDSVDFVGLTANSTGHAYGFNWDGNLDVADAGAVITAGTAYVIEWYHSGGNVGISVNGATDVIAASGNTTNVSGVFSLGGTTSGTGAFDGKIFEVACFSALPSSGTRAALVTSLRTWCGA